MKLSNQNKIVVGVIALILALTVGYAIFSETLNIGGTASASGEFSLIFNTVGEIKEVGSHGTTVTGEKTKALDIRNITLEYPSSYVEIPVTIKNIGTIDAKLKGIEVSNLSNGDITVTYSGVAQDEIIKATEEKEMKIKITWNEGSKTTLSTLEDFSIGLKYEQVTGENGGGSNPGGIVFPKVSGKLGDNVNFYYDNGVIDITGFGPMWDSGTSEDGTSCVWSHANNSVHCPLGEEIAKKVAETISTGNEKFDIILPPYLSLYIMGTSFVDFGEGGISREEIEQGLLTPEPNGPGLTQEEVDKYFEVLDAVPKLKAINIEEGITSIRGDYFFDFANVDTLTIPNSVTSIGNSTFYNVTIGKLYFGTGLTSLFGTTTADMVFACADSVNRINNFIMPDGVVKLGTELSQFCIEELKYLTIPPTVTEISERALEGNPDLEEIVNKTGRSFDWNAILNTGTTGEAFEIGTVVNNNTGKTITITK